LLEKKTDQDEYSLREPFMEEDNDKSEKDNNPEIN